MSKKNIIDDKIVKHVARLSRLELSEKEIKLYSGQLAKIISYIDKLNEVDISNTTPTSHPLENLKNVFRKDVVKKSLSIDEALKNAPKRHGDFFSVPKILE